MKNLFNFSSILLKYFDENKPQTAQHRRSGLLLKGTLLVPSVFSTKELKCSYISLLNPTGHYMHHQHFNIQQFYALYTFSLTHSMVQSPS
jgi:hypothetical protein